MRGVAVLRTFQAADVATLANGIAVARDVASARAFDALRGEELAGA